MRSNLSLVPATPPPPLPTPALLRTMDRTGAEDARADAAAGDYHLYQLMGRLYDAGKLHQQAWARYTRAYEGAMARGTESGSAAR